MPMDFFKTWIMPPLIGTIIGYFTNWLAIKMLFRPLKPVYLGKFKLPFTPGILPRERARLTDSVGETVSRELLTTEVFRSRLGEPALLGKIEQSVLIILDGMLSGDAEAMLNSFAGGAPGAGLADTAGTVLAPDPAPGLPGIRNFSETDLGGLVTASLGSVLRSAEFRLALADAAVVAAAEAGMIPIGAILPPDRLKDMAERFAEEWGNEERQDMVDAFLDRLLDPRPAEAPLVSARTLSPLIEVATRSLYANLIPVVGRIAVSDSVKAELSAMAMEMVRRAIGRLGPIQRLIVTAANYEKTLAETMPETIRDVSDSLLGLLKTPGMEEKVVASVLTYAETPRISHSSAPVAGILPVPELKNALRLFFRGLRNERESFAANVEARYLSVAGKPLREFLPGLSEALAGSISKDLSDMEPRDLVMPGRGAEILSAGLSAFLLSYAGRMKGRTIGELLSLGEAERRKIAVLVSNGVTLALASQAERLVEALDIRSMVVDKIGSLDMADVERIILQVVKDELAWITVLGGVLGALIGIIQSLLSLI